MQVLLHAALLAFPSLHAGAVAQDAGGSPTATDVRLRCQAIVDDLTERGVPGVSAALLLPDGELLTLTAGHADPDAERPMTAADHLLSGSVGKTYVTAVAHHLVAGGKLDLHAKAASYWGEDEPEWVGRIPNGREATVRQLLQHTAGLPRYVFNADFVKTLATEPDRVWKPEELLAFVFDAEPVFAAGKGWSYADTNYIVAGMVIERVCGMTFYEYALEHLIEPHGLKDTLPTNRRDLPDMAQGTVVVGRQMGVAERALDSEGVFTFNIQFEWCGGGWANTPADLARWAKILYSGAAFDAPYLDTLLDGVDAPMLGPGAQYGLGAMMRETKAGRVIHHDGFMPGYLSTMGWFPDSEIAVAIQLNVDDSRLVGRPLPMVMVELVEAVLE